MTLIVQRFRCHLSLADNGIVMTKADFATFTRQDGYAFTVRKDFIAAYMPAAGEGTLLWLKGAKGDDFHHVRDKVAAVTKALTGV